MIKLVFLVALTVILLIAFIAYAKANPLTKLLKNTTLTLLSAVLIYSIVLIATHTNLGSII